MKARQFIKDCTRSCSNELCAVEDKYGKKVISYHEWLTPEQALAAVEIAREEMIDTIEVKEINSTDALVEKAWDWIEDNLLPSNQQDKSRLYFEQFKNYIKE